jgi:hypothetical protein
LPFCPSDIPNVYITFNNRILKTSHNNIKTTYNVVVPNYNPPNQTVVFVAIVIWIYCPFSKCMKYANGFVKISPGEWTLKTYHSI